MSLIEPKIELWYDAQWNDVTTDVRTEEGGGGIEIERSDRDPDTAQVTFDNAGGKYSPRNPLSPLYGKLGRNTPIRISVPALGGTAQWRFTGTVVSWPPRWDPSETNAWVTVDCAGVRHRLGQGRKPVRSALYRAHVLNSPLAYWSLEGGAVTSDIGGAPMTVTYGQWATSTDDTLPGSAGLPQVTGGAQLTARGTLGDTPGLAAWTVTVWTRIAVDPESAGVEGGTTSVSVRVGGSDIGEIAFTLSEAETGGERYLVDTYTADAPTLIADLSTPSVETAGAISDEWRMLRLTVDLTGGGDLRIRYWINSTLQETFTDAGHSVGWPTRVDLGSFVSSGTTSVDVSVGHLAAWGDFTDPYEAGLGHVGERAAVRFAALAAEEGLTVAVIGTSGITSPMGAQGQRTVLELLQECADADGGTLHESRAEGYLTLRTGLNLVARALDPIEVPYTSILPTLAPVEDDQGTRNDVTVTNPTGGSYRAVQTSGPLNTSDPEDDPDGVGTYDEEVSLNLEAAAQLRGAASMRLSLGTIDAPRYGSVRVDLADVAALAGIDPGSFVLLTGLPAFLPPDDSLQRIRGWTETIDVVQHVLDLDLTPGEPYRAGEAEETTRVSPTLSLTTAAFVAGTDTSMTVERDDSSTRLWITTATRSGDFPFDILVSGVRLTVTGIAGSSDPQTMTITQTPVNGVIKTIPSGSPVTLAQPWRLAR